MVMSPVGLGTMYHCAVEDQQQFIGVDTVWNTVWGHVIYEKGKTFIQNVEFTTRNTTGKRTKLSHFGKVFASTLIG
jgi:hypothetical protein